MVSVWVIKHCANGGEPPLIPRPVKRKPAKLMRFSGDPLRVNDPGGRGLAALPSGPFLEPYVAADGPRSATCCPRGPMRPSVRRRRHLPLRLATGKDPRIPPRLDDLHSHTLCAGKGLRTRITRIVRAASRHART